MGRSHLKEEDLLHEIRKRIGDRKFSAMLREWPRQHRNAQVGRAQFISWLNRYTGRNLTPLVNRWLDSRTTPATTSTSTGA